MNKVETLHKIKAAEDQVRAAKEAVLAEQERIQRDARREALELGEELRRQTEARYAQILREAEAKTARETETLMAAGRKEAEAVGNRAGANMDRAIDLLIVKFKGAMNA